MTRRSPTLLCALLLLSAGAACNDEAPTAAAVPAKEEAHAEADSAAAPAEAEEPSDLDRPIAELLALTCEHDRKTYECDECRYETGFVRAPATVMQGGLFTTANPAQQTIAVPIALTGEIQFDERRIAQVGSQVEGVVTKVHVALGDRVRRGQALLELDSVAAGEGQAAYLEAEGLQALARGNFERVAALRQENIASEKEYLEAKQELDAAEIRAAGALGKLNRLGSGAGGGGVVLRAPLDGTVLRLHAVSGEVARSDAPLVTVGDNSSLWVWADLYERDIAVVKRGQAVQQLAASISVKAYPGEEFPGVVDLVSPAMDESSRTVKVRVLVRNGDGRLLAGMFARVALFLPGTEATLAVPRVALLEDAGRSFVFVHHQGDYYVRRPVVPGRAWAGWVEIKQGLTPAQTVVVEGAFLLKSDVLRAKMGAGCAD